jgi:type I restriction enzyme S subunit
LTQDDARNAGALPDGWVWTALGEIADLFGGGTPSRKVPAYFGGDIVWLTPTQIPKDRISVISDSQERITEEALWKSSARLLPAGTVLMTSRASIGYVAIAGTEVSTNQGFASFVCQEGVYNLYLAYWLWGSADAFIREATGTTFKEISKSKLRLFRFPLPPLAEQRRIVAEIETQFTRLETGVTALKRAQANLRRYKAAVLKAACEGRLVPTEAELARRGGVTPPLPYEPADALLQRILAERRAKWQAENPGKPYHAPAPPDTSKLPTVQDLPECWTWATAEQLSDETRSITYGVIKLGNIAKDGVPTLRSSDVRHLRLDLANVKRISPEIADKYKRTFLQGGEVVVTVRGTLGGVVVVPEECKGYNISREVAMIALAELSIGPIIALFIGSRPIQNWLLQRTRGIAYTGINIGTLKQTPIPLPPLAEQHRIVAEVERRLSVVGELEKQVEAALRRAERLRQAILKRAFEGRLVPQDPTDEPASVLLARIQAERRSSQGQRRDRLSPKARQPRLPEL